MVKTYFILLIAIICEVAGTMLLPVTQNFTKVIPTLCLTIFYLASFYLMTFVMDKLPIAIVYATWSGLGVFTIAILGYIFFKQTLAWQAVLGLFLIVYGGHLMVVHVSNVARYLGVSDWVIAVTIVAAGTSAPEFATSIAAALKGRHGIAIGNLIGSDLFNLLGVLGLAGMINPSNITKFNLALLYFF